MLNFDVAATYTVFLRTIRDAQRFHGGATGNMPSYAPAFGNGLTAMYGLPNDLADPGWAAAYGLLCEYLHSFYGDNRIWEDHYDHVARYIDFVAANATEPDGLFTYSRFGDWCPFKWVPGDAAANGPSGMGGCYGLSPMSSSFFFAKQLDILQRAATRLRHDEDAAKWQGMLTRVTAAYRKRFMQPDGTFSDTADGRGTQAVMGSQALALAFPSPDLLTDAERKTVGNALVTNVQSHGNHPYSGELSVTYLFDGLADAGRPDVAVAMASNPEQPGWGFMVEQGATTMYESYYTDRYSSFGSRFHDMFIGPYTWFFRGLGGLRQQPGTVGWKRLRIAPQAYNFWSFPQGDSEYFPGSVEVVSASWGGNCLNASSRVDLSEKVRAVCGGGKSECRFRIPEDNLCHDPPPPPPPPPPPQPPPPPVCTSDGCHLIALPPATFFTGAWDTEFKAVKTEAACKAACLKSAECAQVTWLVRPQMPCSRYTKLSGGWPPAGRIVGVSAFVKCFGNATTAQECNRNPPPPPPAPPPRPLRRKVFDVTYSCGSTTPPRVRTLGPDKGSPVGDSSGVSFTEASGRMAHLDCKTHAATLHFASAETTTYQGRVASAWRVLPRADASSTQSKIVMLSRIACCPSR